MGKILGFIKLFFKKLINLFKKKKMSLNEVDEFNKKILTERIEKHKRNIIDKEKENDELKKRVSELEEIDDNIAVAKEIREKEAIIDDNKEDIALSKQRIDRYNKELESIKGSH